MPPPSRTKQPTDLPDLQWLMTDDGSRTLWDVSLNESYHSGCGAVAESLIVYLKNSGVLHRLFERKATRIFEMGFGTGTACLLTAALAEKLEVPVDYWTIDLRPLPGSLIAQLDLRSHIDKVIADNFAPPSSEQNADVGGSFNIVASDFDLLPKVTENLSHKLDRNSEAFSSLSPAKPSCLMQIDLGEFFKVHLIIGDMTSIILARDYPQLLGTFESIYFDAFSPETNPALWSPSVMAQMRQLLVNGGTLTSYCVKSVVRKTLQEVGFSVTRLPGPVGGKREVLRAFASE